MRRSARPIALALVAVAAVVLPYIALGGATYEPARVADPCETREWRDPGGLEEVLEQVILSALDGAACDLGVSREDLVLAVRSEDALEDFAEERGLTREDAEQAVEEGLVRAVDDAEEADALPGWLANIARDLVQKVPPWLLLETLENAGGFLPG